MWDCFGKSVETGIVIAFSMILTMGYFTSVMKQWIRRQA
jgi:hypothetical protein